MGQLLLVGVGPVGSHRDPKLSVSTRRTFLGTIFGIKATEKGDFVLDVQTPDGHKKIIIGFTHIPKKIGSLSIGDRFEFACKPNSSSTCSSNAKWRAYKEPMIPISEYDYSPFGRHR